LPGKPTLTVLVGAVPATATLLPPTIMVGVATTVAVLLPEPMATSPACAFAQALVPIATVLLCVTFTPAL
jgi:hypothetical protein